MANETSTGSSVVKDARTANLRKGDVKSLAERDDSAAEITVFLQAGIVGFFTDDLSIGRAVMDTYLGKK
ncbi:hypothetical protein [Iodobacter fluviatilis]|nr:hypothetical protein [Iodobacter fluviatilis]